MIEIKQSEIPIYRGTFVVIVTDSKEELNEYVPDFEDDSIYAHSILTDWEDKQGFVCVLNFNETRRNITHGCVAHEATHIAHMILEQRGVIPDFINDEPVAYLVEWITDAIYSACKKHKVKRKGYTNKTV